MASEYEETLGFHPDRIQLARDLPWLPSSWRGPGAKEKQCAKQPCETTDTTFGQSTAHTLSQQRTFFLVAVFFLAGA